jgi:glycosyltransferase involved in cell wall biosynthesis
MIVFCEPLRWNQEHVPVNRSLLEAVRLAYPDEEIRVYGEKQHLVHLSGGPKGGRLEDVEFVPLELPARHATLRYRLLPDVRLTRFMLNRFKRDEHNLLIFTSITVTILWTLRLFVKNVDVWAIYHSGLQTLVGWRSRNPLKRIQDLETAIRFACKGQIQLIVLEKPILDTINHKIPELNDCVHLIDHPIPPGKFEVAPLRLEAPLQFGFLGLATKQKGIFAFIDVAAKVKNKFAEKADFHVIGRLHQDIDTEYLPAIDCLTTKPSKLRLKRELYEKLVRRMHYVCLFFEGRQYDVTASGVLLDCIGREKPIVTSDIALFHRLEEQYGDIGLICKDGNYEKMIAKLIENPDPQRYRRQVENLRKAKNARSPSQLALKIKALRIQTGCAADQRPCKGEK